MLRLLKGYLRSRREKRPVFPKDLWNPKGIMAGGVDTKIYRKDIESYWGVTPFDVYAATETMFLGMQSWSRRFMTFLPDSVFLEFLPLGGPGNGRPLTERAPAGRSAGALRTLRGRNHSVPRHAPAALPPR